MSFLHEAVAESAPKHMTEVGNIILAYAMACVFMLKGRQEQVSADRLITLLENYFADGSDTINFSSSETASTTYDQISLRTPASDEAREYIINNILDQDDTSMFLVNNIISFVNQDVAFNSLVAQVTNNGLINRIIIDVDSISVEDPKRTSVIIDNETVNVFQEYNIVHDFRQGIGNIGQRELNKDYGYEVQRQFIERAFGLDIGPDSGVYYQAANNNNNPTVDSIQNATRKLYEEVCRRLNQGVAGVYNPLNDFGMVMSSKMIECCYGANCENDGTCLIIPHNREGYKSFAPKEAAKTLRTSGMQAHCPAHTNPSIRIVDDNKKELFQLRFKKERYNQNVTGHRYKLYFSPGKLEGILK